MKNTNTIITLLSILVIAAFFLGFGMNGTEIKYVDKTIVTEKLIEQTCPEIVIDNYKTDKIFEETFGETYSDIEEAAYVEALNELEDDSYEVIEDYFRILEGYDKDSVDVDVEDFNVEVTNLGLEDDEDKVAIVTFELEVEYELEEGINDDFKKKLTIIYKVTFDEGDFDDEKVKLISLA